MEGESAMHIGRKQLVIRGDYIRSEIECCERGRDKNAVVYTVYRIESRSDL